MNLVRACPREGSLNQLERVTDDGHARWMHRFDVGTGANATIVFAHAREADLARGRIGGLAIVEGEVGQLDRGAAMVDS